MQNRGGASSRVPPAWGDRMEIAVRSHLLLLLELEDLLHELVELDHRERSLAAPVVPARGRKGAYGVHGHKECEGVHEVRMGCA